MRKEYICAFVLGLMFMMFFHQAGASEQDTNVCEVSFGKKIHFSFIEVVVYDEDGRKSSQHHFDTALLNVPMNEGVFCPEDLLTGEIVCADFWDFYIDHSLIEKKEIKHFFKCNFEDIALSIEGEKMKIENISIETHYGLDTVYKHQYTAEYLTSAPLFPDQSLNNELIANGGVVTFTLRYQNSDQFITARVIIDHHRPSNHHRPSE